MESKTGAIDLAAGEFVPLEVYRRRKSLRTAFCTSAPNCSIRPEFILEEWLTMLMAATGWPAYPEPGPQCMRCRGIVPVRFWQNRERRFRLDH